MAIAEKNAFTSLLNWFFGISCVIIDFGKNKATWHLLEIHRISEGEERSQEFAWFLRNRADSLSSWYLQVSEIFVHLRVLNHKGVKLTLLIKTTAD